MLIEYYSIRIKDAEPGKGSLHVTPHYDEVRSSLKHFKEKHPDKKVVAFKHELKKGPMGISHKRKEMFGESVSLSGGYGSGHHEYDKWRTKGGVDAWKKHVKSIHKGAKFSDSDDVTHAHVGDVKVGGFSHSNMSSETLIKEELIKESTKSFKTLMRSIEDKKSIKNLHVPTPAERKAEAERFAASQKKTEPVKEDVTTSDNFSEVKHKQVSGNDSYEVRGEKYPNLRRPRHAIFKNGKYHSMAGTLLDAKARVEHISNNISNKG